jgi:Uma2 family endonuclease
MDPVWWKNGVDDVAGALAGAQSRARPWGGRAVSEMLFDLGAGLSQRRPDVAYVSYDRWARHRRVPRTQAWAVVPELTVEVISPSNTFEEILGKVHEYFQAGVQRVWVVPPPLTNRSMCISLLPTFAC